MYTLQGGAINWRSVKQSSIADSTIEVEYIAASEAAKEAVFLLGLGMEPSAQSAITFNCDNSRAVANLKDSRSHKRGKHIERKYHLI